MHTPPQLELMRKCSEARPWLWVDESTGRPASAAADRGLRLCCWMNVVERELFSRPFEARSNPLH